MCGKEVFLVRTAFCSDGARIIHSTSLALTPGTRLGPYEILSALGAGGMGEVYRAMDTKLHRDVAIKVLPALFVNDPERLARFQREAQVLASLNHPNIAGIYGLEESGGMTALVMELVEGDDLAQRVASGAIPIDEALPIAKQIADALEAAHEQGIIHRDLKPANIKVRSDGTVKVLDFGLAKAMEPPAGSSPSLSISPTITSPAMTQAGMILGTAAYMSPEQARGKTVDKRADIWAFGAVLFEMLTGRRAFVGEDITDTIVSVISKEPDWSALPPATSASARSLLRRCLEKDPKRRMRDIGDARWELDESHDPVLASVDSVPALVPSSSWSRRAAGLAVVSVAVALATGGLAGRWWERRQAPAPVEWRGDLLGGSTVAMSPRVSPDGQLLAFLAMVDGQTQVAVMKPQSGNWAILSHERARGLVQDLSWSRDGTRIFFDRFSGVPRGVFSIPSLGGDERLILEDAGWPQPLADGSLLLVRINAQRVSQLFHFWPDTGRLDALNAFFPSFAGSGVSIRVFPDGREAVFAGTLSDSPTVQGWYAIDLTSGRTRRLTTTASTNSHQPVPALAITPDGQSVLFDLPAGNVHRIVQVSRDGSGMVRSLVTLTAQTSGLDVGPDGSLYVGQAERIADVFWYSPPTGKVERRTLPDAAAQSDMLLPLPDGRVLFRSTSAGRDQLAVLAPGKDAVPFLETEEPTTSPMSLVGKDRVAFLIGNESSRKIAIASLVDGRILRRLARPDAANVSALAGSPDGKTLYYVESGIVWAMPSEGGEPKKVHEGDQVAVDPTDQSLVIEVTTRDAVRLVRVPAGGGAEQAIPMPSGVRLFTDLSPSAVALDGRIAVRIVPKDSWFWPAAVLDPRSGGLTQLPGVRDLDMPKPAWGADGRLVSLAQPERSSLWRFRPVTASR